ncbi:MAG: hypothetical protein SNH88_08095 [Rikenellaceae bacterium]
MKRFLFMLILALLPMMGSAQPMASRLSNAPKESAKGGGSVKFEVAPFEFEIIGDNSVALVGYDYGKEPNPEATELIIPEQVTFENKSYRVTNIEGKRTGSYFIKNKHISRPSQNHTLPLLCSQL